MQSFVTLSTTEAEYVAATEAGKEIMWMRNILTEMGYTPSAPSQLWIDNQSALSVTKNPEHHGRMKHLDLRFFWLRDAVHHKRLGIHYIPTEQQAADSLTKALHRIKIQEHRELLGLRI